MPAKKATKKAVKKTAVKAAPTKAAPAKKAAAKKAPAKKAAAAPLKKVSKTSVIAQVDVGFGNLLYIRGEGAGLSWDKGVAMVNISPYEWAFESKSKDGDITFKLLINDEIWAEGDNTSVAAGTKIVCSPFFGW